MAQLKLIFYADTMPVQDVQIPDGFRVRNIRDCDLAEYNRLRHSVDFAVWQPEDLAKYRQKAFPDGMFTIEEIRTGRFTAAANAEWINRPEFADVGYLGWVMSDPDFRGMRLGRSISITAMQHLYLQGYRVFVLDTDDFRIPALKVYLSLGWRPWLFQEDMPERWRAIAAILGMDFEDLKVLPEKIPFPPKCPGISQKP